MNELTLRYEEMVERLAGRRADLEPIARRMEAIPGELVDENEATKRQALIVELDGLQRQERVILLEIRELEQRRRAAYIATYEHAEAEARETFERARAKAVELHQAADQVTAKLRGAINGGIPEEIRGDQEKIVLYIADLRGQHARAWALSVAADGARRRAGAAWQAIREQLEQVCSPRTRVLPFPGPAHSSAA